jgi:hypothetical protein
MIPVSALPKVRKWGFFREEMGIRVVAAGADQHLATGLCARFIFIVFLMPDSIELPRRQIQ